MTPSPTQKSYRSSSAFIESVLPPLPSWRTFPRACATLLIFELTVLGGEWVVHQLAYLIEYGSRFGTVMATTPHRYYMGRLGLLFALAVLSLLSLAALVLRLDALKRQRVLPLLPARLRRFIPAVGVRVPPSVIGRTALLLAFLQMAVYLAQENLEAQAEGAGLPGLAVLVAPAHWPVVPLHLLIALCSSFVLWTLATWRRSSSVATQIAETLARLLAGGKSEPLRCTPTPAHVPHRLLITGIARPRAPPLLA